MDWEKCELKLVLVEAPCIFQKSLLYSLYASYVFCKLQVIKVYGWWELRIKKLWISLMEVQRIFTKAVITLAHMQFMYF